MTERTRFDLVQTACFGLVAAVAAVTLVAAVALDGISIGGSACGGGGAEQACRDVDRRLTVGLDLGWFSAALILLTSVLVVVGVMGLVRPGLRLALAVVVLGVAFAGLVGTEHVSSRFCPGVPGATCGRTDDEWGPVLRPALLELRADARARLVGRPVRPGAPVVEVGQTLDSFRAAGRAGWNALHAAAVVMWFLALALLLPRVVTRPWQAALAVVTVGLTSWAIVVDRTHPCAAGAAECYRGLVVTLALLASGVLWGLAFAVVFVVRSVRRHA
jgi:hypothetical protein